MMDVLEILRLGGYTKVALVVEGRAAPPTRLCRPARNTNSVEQKLSTEMYPCKPDPSQKHLDICRGLCLLRSSRFSAFAIARIEV